MQRQRIVKLVATVESEKHDWGFQVNHKSLGLVASGKTEQEALDKIDLMISRQLEFDLVHGLKRPAKAGR
jgi:hypothetical protein